MKWYLDKYEELKKVTPIISVCGDDCAVCPRFLAKTDNLGSMKHLIFKDFVILFPINLLS